MAELWLQVATGVMFVSTQIRGNNPEETVLYQKMNGWRLNGNNGALATKDFSIAHWYYIIAFECHVFGKERNILWMLKRELDRSCRDGGLGPRHAKHCHWHSWPLALFPQQQELQLWDEFAIQHPFS